MRLVLFSGIGICHTLVWVGMSLITRIAIYFGIIFLSTSCSFSKKDQWSVLIIGVENLGFEDLSCNGIMDSNLIGFKKLCEDAVYFTHAYAPSTYSASNVATILTAQYAFEHKLQAMDSFLSEEKETLPELMINNGFKTSFMSSGGGLFRKKGVDQGFEVFDDKLKVASNKLFRSADQVNKLFKKWMNKQYNKKIFSFLYYSDPLFPNSVTVSNDNVERSLTRGSQIEELSESIEGLVYYLKSNKRWDSTMVIFTGLNGVSNKENVAKFDNLFSENTHIPLLIKPPKKNRDLGISWTIDKNVTLVDIGILLRKYFKLRLNPSFALNEDINLVESLEKPVSDWANERPIISESSWLGKGKQVITKYAIRFASILYFHKSEPELYNSLIDRQEISKIGVESYQYKKINKVLADINFSIKKSWNNYPKEKILSDFVYQFWFDKSEIELWPVEFLIEESKTNSYFYELLVNWLLSNKKWNQINKLQKYKPDGDLQFILSKYLVDYDIKDKKSICFSAFINKNKSTFLKNCKDELSLVLWSFYNEKNKSEKKKKLRLFARLYNFRMLNKKINIYNIANGFSWFYPKEKFVTNSWIDKLKFLPEYKSLFSQVKNFKH